MKGLVAVKPKVIVADDHRLVAEGIVKILEKAYSVVATPADGRSFIEAAEKFHGDQLLFTRQGMRETRQHEAGDRDRVSSH